MSLALHPTLEASEDAIVAALQADTTIDAYCRDAISSFEGSWRQVVEETSRRMPAIVVLFAGAEIEPSGMVEDRVEAEWHVLCLAKNLRNERARRNPESSGEVGAYAIVQDVLRVLTRSDCDLESFGELYPQGIDLVEGSRQRSIYRLVFTNELELREVADVDDLDRVDLTIEVPNPDEDNDGEIAWVEVGTDNDEEATEVVDDLAEES